MMKKHTSTQLLDELARESLGQDITLSSDLMIKVRKEKYKAMKKRTLIITLASVVVVVGLLAAIPNVAQAIGRLFGFIPGAGIVEQSVPLRILKEPVESEIGSAKVIVSQAMTDTEHLRLFYQVENLPAIETATSQTQDLCHALPKLKLTDGSTLDAYTISGNFWGSGYSRQIEFAALPAEDNSAVLVFPCFEGSLRNDGAKEVEIKLDFVNAPADMTVYPIVELPTPTAAESQQPAVTTADHLKLEVNKYIQAEGQIIIMGAVKSDSPEVGLSWVDPQDVHLVDAAGNTVVISQDYSIEDPQASLPSPQLLPFTYKTDGAFEAGKATLVVDRMWIGRQGQASFTFDPGLNPKPGQIWPLNKTLTVDGHPIVIKEVALGDDGISLSFKYEADENISNLSLVDLEHQSVGGGGGDENTGFTYIDGFPSGLITINLNIYDERISGPWKAEIDLPAFTDGSAPTPLPEACLTNASWAEALKSGSIQIPDNLGGQLILNTVLPPEYYYHVMLANLSGSDPTDLGFGDDASLSPDGKTLLYSTDQGLTLRDMSSGNTSLIAGTSKRDRGAIWSPDGKLIAFSKGPASGLIGAAGPYELMLMNADGTDQRSLFADNSSNNAQAWMPNSKNLVFTTRRPEGVIVQSINIETGSVSLLTQINYQNAGVVISHDGKQIAYEAMLPGEKYSVYTSNLDGSDARLIANGDPIVVTRPFWSPDGKWLIMSVYDTSLSEDSATLALVNLETCQIIPLKSLHGHVTSWR